MCSHIEKCAQQVGFRGNECRRQCPSCTFPVKSSNDQPMLLSQRDEMVSRTQPGSALPSRVEELMLDGQFLSGLAVQGGA
jgi:hypothetical protein